MASDQSKSVKLYSFAIGLCDKFDRGFRDSGTHSASFCCFIRAEVEVGCCAAPSSIKTQIWQIIVIGPAHSRLIRVIRSAPGLLRKLGRPWNLRNHHMEFWLVVYTFAYFFDNCFFSWCMGYHHTLSGGFKSANFFCCRIATACLNSVPRVCLATVCLMRAVCWLQQPAPRHCDGSCNH